MGELGRQRGCDWSLGCHTFRIDDLHGNWNYPTSIRFGAGRIEELAEVCTERGLRRPLVVTGPGLVETNIVQRVMDALGSKGVPAGLYTGVQVNPVLANVEGGLIAFEEGRHDGVIALGGGSPLDVGKAVAFMSGQTRPLWDFEDVGDNFKRANPEGIAQVIAIPTTAGTGSEVGRAAVIPDERTHTKRVIFHPKMLPVTAILDPELTLGMSPKMTAGSCMDALAHNLEALVAVGFHPLADGIAVEGVRLVKEWLPSAVADGANVTSRSYMLAAAAMGATAFQKGLGAVHALSHPLGAVYNLHHGLLNGVLLPYVLQFNRPAIEPRIVSLAASLQVPDPCFDSFMEWLLELRSQVGIPHTLADLGVSDDRIELLSKMAEGDPSAAGNPVPLAVSGLQGMYRMALSGEVKR